MSTLADPSPDAAASAAWREAVERVLKGADIARTLVARTHEGIPVAPLLPKVEAPQPLPWRRPASACRVVQRIDHPDPVMARALAVIDAAQGADELAIVFAGSPVARGFGVGVELAADLVALLPDRRLDAIPLRFERAPFSDRPSIADIRDAADRDAVDPGRLVVDWGLDPIGDMAVSGFARSPWPAEARRAAAFAREVCDADMHGPALRADGRPHHDAGAGEAQELAAVLAAGVAYLRALDEAAIPLDRAAALIGFALAADADMFLGLAKCRALRRLWARVEETCGLVPLPIRLHVDTSWRALTRADPWTNLLRGTLGAAAAILGGADSVTVLPFTAALGLPDAFARRLARNTPLVLLGEAGLGRVADPAEGSGAIEAITDALCREAWRLFQEIEAAGGLPAALACGLWQDRIAAVRAGRLRALAEGGAPIVGTSVFVQEGEQRPPVLLPFPERRPDAETVPHAFAALVPIRDAEPIESAGEARR